MFGTSAFEDLDADEMMALARRGGAVSPVTSYLAIEPGVRPSTEGLDWDQGEGIGLGSIGTLGHGSGTGSGSGFSYGFSEMAFLRAEIGASWVRCGGERGTARVELETTKDEIVDVINVQLAIPDPTKESCLREAVWDLELDSAFASYRRRFTVEV